MVEWQLDPLSRKIRVYAAPNFYQSKCQFDLSVLVFLLQGEDSLDWDCGSLPLSLEPLLLENFRMCLVLLLLL